MKHLRFVHLLLAFGFLLGVKNGCIALYRQGQSQPVRVFPYPVRLFPEQDQQALEKGISISDTAQLERLLEDYLS